MRVLRPVVQALVLPVLHARHNLALGRSVAGQFVGDHYPEHPELALEPQRLVADRVSRATSNSFTWRELSGNR